MRCADEKAALELFCERVRSFDPDVLTGWNTIDFDLTALQRIAARVRHPFELGRDAGAMKLRKAEGYFGSGQANVPGRLVLDGIDLLRGAFVRMDDYSLDAVAREVLGEGKAVAGDVRDRVAEIQHNYAHDLPAFALYARTDARLAFEIVAKLNLVPLAFARSALTGMTPDRVAASIASFDFLVSVRARAPQDRRADRALRRLARARRAARRPRARARDGVARERLGVRLQEPLPEHHPHVQYRSARLRRGTATGRRSHRDAGRRVSPRAGDPAAHARRAVPAPRSGEARRRRRRVAGDQDPHELVLRRARHAGVPFFELRARKLDHGYGPRDVALVETLVRGSRIPCALRRYRQLVRAFGA